MNDITINNEVTMGGASATLLAGRYRVVKQLGQGGMGSVWLAEDTKLDNHQVAIKMLPSILVNNKRAYAQVKQEALVSLKLSHSNIATVRAFEEEGGNPFLVMDYIDGQSLDDYLAEKGTLTEDETIRLLKPVAAALDYAHGQGVVHRDVKPGNIMIAKNGMPYVLDFGIAREIQETMTRVTGKLSSGTLMYMSPEQLHGAAPKPAQDVYSFAAMAYECLTGHPPFSRGQIEYQIEHDTPEPLDSKFARCASGVMAGLAKKPEERPASCAAVLSAGSRVPRDLADDGVPAGRARGVAVLLGVLALAAAVGGGWWWHERVKSEEFRMKNEALAAERARQTKPVAVAPAVPSVPVAPSVLEVAPAPKPVVDDDADKRRQAEVAKLATMRTRISIKVAAAKDDYAKVAPYRSEKEGFESHLTEIDRQWETVEGVRNPKNLAEAEKTFAAVSEAADAIAFELNWLATNRDGRDAAKRIEEEIVDELEPKLREFKADDVAKSKYDKGQGERKASAQALARGEFASARRQYEAAKVTLTEALAEARQFHVKTTLAVANEYKNAAQWQRCIDEAEKVLGWEPQNAEALTLKADAESHFAPTLRIVAKIGDREVPATATLNGKSFRLPWVWNKNIRVNSRIPSSEVAVEYAENGRQYIGTIKPVTVDWLGLKTITIELVEQIGVQLWENGPYWATCNVGATKPEECGYYFWWGDTVGYKRNANNNGWVSVKNETEFSFSNGNCPTYDKDNSQLQSAGYIDSTGNLVAAHDAATVHLGAPWRMPTKAEFAALINNCDTEWTSRNGVSGRLVKGRGAYASRSIFLPAVGYGFDSYLNYLGSIGDYWSSTPDSGNSNYAWYLYFTSGHFYRNGYYRDYGQSVRPVRGFAK